MKLPKSHTPDNAYKTAKNNIANLIGFMECELEKRPDTITWGMYGSLRHVENNLIETLAFMSGIDEKTIRESLEDAAVDSKEEPKP